MDTLEQLMRRTIFRYYTRNHKSRQNLVDRMTEQTTRNIYELNQFVNLTHQDSRTLNALYGRFVHSTLRALDSGRPLESLKENLSSIASSHSSLLRHFLLTIHDSGLIDSDQNHPIACIEYSPALQLRLLGVPVSDIQEPILDIGCGREGRLVHQLREWGYEAYGVDRNVMDHPYLLQSDWSAFRWQRETWGTVISHMAFSNHFNHHHLRKNGQPEVYARIFMDMLQALKKSGSFYYAPGLPFMEELLPTEKYRIARIQDDMQKEFYSTQIVKLD